MVRRELNPHGVGEGRALYRLDEHVVDEIRQRLDIVEVIGDYVPLRRAGREYVALCPFHDERTPSFTVSPAKQMFYCFGCQVGGDVFTFVMKKEGWTFPEAVAHLARRAGVALRERPLSPGQRRVRDRQEQLARVLEMAAAFFRQALRSPAGEAARAYLEERGLPSALWDRYGLGYAPPGWDGLVGALERRGVAPALLAEAGLAQPRPGGGYYDRFRHRVMFPITDPRGRVVGFGGRSLDGQEPKYLNSPETVLFNKRRLWYGLDWSRPRLRETGTAVVVEGYMDAIAVDRAGVGYAAVASLGTSLSEEQVELLARYVQRVIIAYDADAAGQRATMRGLAMFADAGVEVRVAQLPPGRDPDDVVRREGPDALRRILEAAVPVVEYRFRQVMGQVDTATPRGRAEAVEALAPWLARVSSPVERGEYVRRYAVALGVEEGILWQEVRRAARALRSRAPATGRPARGTLRGSIDGTGGVRAERGGRAGGAGGTAVPDAGGNNVQAVRHTNRRVPVEEVPAGVVRAERGLVAASLFHPQWQALIASRLEPGDWVTPAHRLLFELACREAQTTGGGVDTGRVLSRLHSLAAGGGDIGRSETGRQEGNMAGSAENERDRDADQPQNGVHDGVEERLPAGAAGSSSPAVAGAAVYQEAVSVLAALVQAPEPGPDEPGEMERILDDYIKTLKRHSLWKIQRRIAQLEASGQDVPVDLVTRFQLLSAQLKGRVGR
ncbi:DNA primase [Thermaerobacter sp. PB12/4term]|uniref:DNA primase n=1 Tax=Thermaerobacter sp. PB12/4term TaxID=2293838 RepID=UPI001FAC68F2|nr:DNA primase [Thermaerobacter sp. PB12/4term]